MAPHLRQRGVRMKKIVNGELVDLTPEEVAALTAPPSKDALLAYSADIRWRQETSGIAINGAVIDTGRESQAMINGAFALAKDDPAAVIQFKAATGFVSLDSATMVGIARAVGAYVQACFAKEAGVAADIEAGSATSFADIDARWM